MAIIHSRTNRNIYAKRTNSTQNYEPAAETGLVSPAITFLQRKQDNVGNITVCIHHHIVNRIISDHFRKKWTNPRSACRQKFRRPSVLCSGAANRTRDMHLIYRQLFECANCKWILLQIDQILIKCQCLNRGRVRTGELAKSDTSSSVVFSAREIFHRFLSTFDCSSAYRSRLENVLFLTLSNVLCIVL